MVCFASKLFGVLHVLDAFISILPSFCYKWIFVFSLSLSFLFIQDYHFCQFVLFEHYFEFSTSLITVVYIWHIHIHSRTIDLNSKRNKFHNANHIEKSHKKMHTQSTKTESSERYRFDFWAYNCFFFFSHNRLFYSLLFYFYLLCFVLVFFLFQYL